MQYFAYMGNVYASKNSYQKLVQALIESHSNRLINGVEAFKKQLLADIKVLHKNYPRCKQLEVSWYDAGDVTNSATFGLTFGQDTVCTFYLYPVHSSEWRAPN